MNTRKLLLFMFAALLGLSQQAVAADLLDWLQVERLGQKAHPLDDAALLTLEPGEMEMYPKVSPNGKMFLALTIRGKRMWITNRYVENGDPANVVTEDPRALDSIDWKDDEHVVFLSMRAGGLGLWEKAADGLGMVKRIARLHENLTQCHYLPDGSIVGVRWIPASGGLRPERRRITRRTDRFINWELQGYRSEIVRILPSGDAKVLSAGVNPAISPDGEWIAFSMAVGRSVHLFRMRIDGSELVQLTSSRSVDVQPAWSPDGQWIVFTSNRSHPDLRHPSKANWDIWAIDRDGRRLTQLTKDPARDGAPSVTPDGLVLFHSDRKVPKSEQQRRMVRGQNAGFHIWTVRLPS